MKAENIQDVTETSDSETRKGKRKGFLEVVRSEVKAPERNEDRGQGEKPERRLFDVSKEQPKVVETEKPQTIEKRPDLQIVESEPVPEAEAPTESLGDAEKRLSVQATAEQMLEEAQPIDPEAPPEQQAADLASQRNLQLVAETGNPAAGLEDMAEDMDIDTKQLEAIKANTAEMVENSLNLEAAESDEIALENDAESDTDTEQEGFYEFGDEELIVDRAAEADNDDVEDEPDDPTATAATPAGTTGATTTGTVGHGAGGHGTAGPGGGGHHGGHAGGGPGGPGGPTPPFGGPHGPGGGHWGLGGPGAPGGGGGFNVMPTPAATAPNTIYQNEVYDRANPAAMALFGGIIGYLIGRRRGRIKTEKRLLPVQKKLEKQVKGLQFEIQENDKKIRRLAAEKVRSQGPAVVEVLAAKAAIQQNKEKPATKLIYKTEQAKPPKTERVRAPEAHQLHGKPESEHHIGQVLIAAEAPILANLRREKY